MKAIPNQGASDMDLTFAFTTVFGRGARKQLAKEACVSPETVKRWFAGEWPESRRRQLAELLIRHADQQQRQLAEIRDRATQFM